MTATCPPIPTDSARKAAAAYLSLGQIPVPVPRGAKGAVLDGWPELRVTPATLPRYFPDDRTSNVGLVLVAGVVDLDLDCEEAVAAGRRWLPRTGWVSGRTHNPRSHYWYRAAGEVAFKAFDGPDGTRLLELRAGPGLQTVVPPGLHPDGDELSWEAWADGPAELAADELSRQGAETATLALLARHWPKVKGRRQDAFLALSGGLARLEWKPGKAEDFLAALAELTDDEETRKRVGTFARTATKVAAGEDTTGWRRLSTLLISHGAAVVRLACEWLGCPAAETDGPQPWPELIPLLTPLPDLPPFPADVLPGWLGDWALATAEALQVPVDLPATLGLAVCSAGVAQKFVACPRAGWTEPINTYWLTALPPSDRKTQTFARAVAPVFDLQDRARAEAAPARREAEATQKALAKRLARIEDQYAKAKDATERQQAMDELRRVREELDGLVVPVVPQLLVDDETPDNLAKTLCEQGGRLLQASAEGTLFENIGRWSEKPSFDVYLKAYSGDPLSVGRVTRERTECRHPALTCAIAPQPAVVEALGEEPALAGRGFLARWFYSLPKSKVGRRVIGPPPVPDPVRDAYRDGVIALWSMAVGEDEDGKPKAWRVPFAPEANRVIRDFERELEPRLGEGADLWPLHGWGGKAAGGAVRIATVLHLAEAAARGPHRLDPVPPSVAERAVRLVRDYLVPHARAAFGLLAADPKVSGARKVVKWFTGAGLAEFSVRDANQAMKGSIRTVDELLPVLDLIERHHYTRQTTADRRTGPGRPRSPRYEVNPEVIVPGRNDSEDTEHSGTRPDRTGPGADRAQASTPPQKADRDPQYPQNGSAPVPNGCSEHFEDTEPRCGPTGGTPYTRPGCSSEPRDLGLENTGDNCGASDDPDRGRAGDQMGAGDNISGQYPQNPQFPVEESEPESSGSPGDGRLAHNSQNPQNSGGPAAGAAREGSGPPAAAVAPGYDGAVPADTPYILIRTASDLQAVVNAVAESRCVGVDCETTGLDPRADRVRLISLDCETNDGGRFAYLVDAFDVDPRPIWEPLAEVEIVLHNAAFDLGFLWRLGFVPGRVHDTLLLSNILYAGGRTRGVAPMRHGLKDCCQRELGVALAKDLQASDWSGPLTHDQLAYAATDAAVLVPLYRALSEKLKADGLERAAAIESGAVPCIAWLSATGVPFDAARWRAIARSAGEEAAKAKAALDAAAPERPGTLFGESWNWDSPEQVKEALRLAGCAVESTADGVLAALDHPLAALLRDYRDAQKRSTTYGDTWLKHVAPDGRIYPRWVQLGANSGRMACGSPNMQNLPRGEYRKCVAAPPGRVLVKADYSQVELRIAAKVSGDRALMAAYDRREDLHTLTARQVLGIADVTKEHRQLAKALNFGLLYGMGAKGFRNYARSHYGLDLTEEQAIGYREAFFRAYPGLRRWHRSVGDAPQDTRTLAGRRCLRVEQFNEKLNLPVQGTGADGLKKALALLWQRRAECPRAIPVLVVHDEVVVECPEADADRAAAWLKQAMLDGMAPLVAPVPVDVEVKVGRTWGGD